jgi:hypothetical protein
MTWCYEWTEARRKAHSERLIRQHAQGIKFAHGTKWTEERKQQHKERLKELHKQGIYESLYNSEWTDKRRNNLSECIKKAWINGTYQKIFDEKKKKRLFLKFNSKIEKEKICDEGRFKGYVQIFIAGYWYYKHRYLMEIKLQRELQKGELVHHINENILDNRIENLQLTNKSEHISIHMKGKTISEHHKEKIREWNKDHHDELGRFCSKNH